MVCSTDVLVYVDAGSVFVSVWVSVVSSVQVVVCVLVICSVLVAVIVVPGAVDTEVIVTSTVEVLMRVLVRHGTISLLDLLIGSDCTPWSSYKRSFRGGRVVALCRLRDVVCLRDRGRTLRDWSDLGSTAWC